jgi:uncharacterized membrane protein (DUF441 family)
MPPAPVVTAALVIGSAIASAVLGGLALTGLRAALPG